MDLGEAWISEKGAPPMGSPDCGAVRSFGVRREVKDIGISTRRKHNYIGSVAVDLTSYYIPRHNAACSAVDNDYV
jgi:hypothetical protein